MALSAPSALITDEGQRVLLRIEGHFYEFSQQELRTLLGLPAGPARISCGQSNRRVVGGAIASPPRETADVIFHRKGFHSLSS